MGNQVIDTMIRSDKGLGWTWEDPYEANGDYAWCGAFAARCYRAAGLSPLLALAYFSSTYRLARYGRYAQSVNHDLTDVELEFESVDDVPLLLMQDDFDGVTGPVTDTFNVRNWHVANNAMRAYAEPTVSNIEPGDILLINFTGKRSYGDHVTIAASYPNPQTGLVMTFEGNAKGFGPNMKTREGVVIWLRNLRKGKRWRKHGYICKVVKPSVLDFNPELRFIA
jgi:hypothetical protein